MKLTEASCGGRSKLSVNVFMRIWVRLPPRGCDEWRATRDSPGSARAVLYSNSLLAASWPGAVCTRGRLPSPMMRKKTLDHHSAADQQATNDLPQCAARSRALHLRLSPRRDHLSQSHILHRLPSLAHWQLTTGLVPGLFVGAFCRDATLRAVNGAHAASKHLPPIASCVGRQLDVAERAA
jgi:hypothetical protein